MLLSRQRFWLPVSFKLMLGLLWKRLFPLSRFSSTAWLPDGHLQFCLRFQAPLTTLTCVYQHVSFALESSSSGWWGWMKTKNSLFKGRYIALSFCEEGFGGSVEFMVKTVRRILLCSMVPLVSQSFQGKYAALFYVIFYRIIAKRLILDLAQEQGTSVVLCVLNKMVSKAWSLLRVVDYFGLFSMTDSDRIEWYKYLNSVFTM